MNKAFLMTYDILIASFYRNKLLKKCLESVLEKESTKLNKIFVLVHKSDLSSQELLAKYDRVKQIVVADIPKPGASRNILIKHSVSPYLFFIDDDAYVSQNYFDVVERLIEKQRYDVIGGPDQAPTESNLSQHVLARLMQSRLLMGPTYKRHSCDQEQRGSEVNLTLCNLWMKRELFFEKGFSFDESLSRCEENVLLEQIEAGENSLLYTPELIVHHHRREAIFDILKIQFFSGYYRGVCFYKEKTTFKLFFLIPIITGLLIFLTPIFPFIIALYLVYFLMTLGLSFKLLYEFKKIKAFVYTMIIVPIIHTGFSIGIFLGSVFGSIHAKR